MKNPLFLILSFCSVAATAAVVRTAFVAARSPAELRVADDGALVVACTDARTPVTLKPRDGWRFASGGEVIELIHQAGQTEHVSLHAKDGEERVEVVIEDPYACDHQITNVVEHVRAPLLEGVGGEHGLSLYPGAERGIASLGKRGVISWVTNGLHHVERHALPCPVPGCTWTEASEAEDREITVDMGVLKVVYQTNPGPIDGRYPAGHYEVVASGTWETPSCPDCEASAQAVTPVDVFELDVEHDEWLGIDRTDEAKATRLDARATAIIRPSFSGTVEWEWTTGPLLEATGPSDAGEFSYGTSFLDHGSERLRGERLECSATIRDGHDACYAGATCVTNYTIVSVDVEIDRPTCEKMENERTEEMDGAFLTYRAWATNDVTDVRFTWEPRDLPDDETMTITASEGMLVERRGAGPYVAAKGAYTVAELKARTFAILPVRPSVKPRDMSIEIEHQKSGARDRALFTVTGAPKLIADYDRNGVIDADDEKKATDGKTIFRFWINDDNDEDGRGTDTLNSNDNPGSGPNAGDEDVDGHMDLEDFTPILLDITDIFPKNTPDEEWDRITWRLKSPCLNAVWTRLESDKVGNYFDPSIIIPNCGDDLDDEIQEADVTKLGDEEGAIVPKQLLRSRGGRRYVAFLVEGCARSSPGVPALQVVGTNKERIWTAELKMSVSPVQEMYRWLNLRGTSATGLHSESLFTAVPSNASDEEVNGCPIEGRHVFFVHGFAVSEDNAEGWGAAIFKRLWQAGVNAKFTVVDWYGDQGEAYGRHPDYYANVVHAFESAKKLVETCNRTFEKDRKYFIAHSLGNMVVSNAIIGKPALTYERYFLVNAAVPMEAYDETAFDEAMIDSEWSVIKADLYAGNWYKLFEDDPDDMRADLAWRGRFTSISNAMNFYSASDEILANRTAERPWNQFGSLEYKAWTNQEGYKGTKVWTALDVLPGIAVRCEGGWGFTEDYKEMWESFGPFRHLKEENGVYAINLLDPRETKARPFFRPLEAIGGFNPHLETTCREVPQRAYLYTARYLADGIPALSNATGANETAGIFSKGDNVNLETCKGENWPRSGGEWYHSDLRNVAFCYVRKFYERLKEEIK